MKNITKLMSSILLSTIISSTAQAVENENELQERQNFFKMLFEMQSRPCPTYPNCKHYVQENQSKDLVAPSTKTNSKKDE